VISRRRWIKTSLWGAAALGLAGVVGRHLSGYSLDAATAARLRALSAKEYLILAAVARRVCAGDGPDAPTPDAVQVALHADAYLANVPEALAADVRALLHLFEHTAHATSRFTHLSPDEQDAVLLAWQKSGWLLKRQGFQALRSLCFMGYWRDPSTWPLLGYTGPMKT
jgi:Gluconate 2-dehydrogenase subunit 3